MSKKYDIPKLHWIAPWAAMASFVLSPLTHAADGGSVSPTQRSSSSTAVEVQASQNAALLLPGLSLGFSGDKANSRPQPRLETQVDSRTRLATPEIRIQGLPKEGEISRRNEIESRTGSSATLSKNSGSKRDDDDEKAKTKKGKKNDDNDDDDRDDDKDKGKGDGGKGGRKPPPDRGGAPVPEPATWIGLASLLALCLLAAWRRRTTRLADVRSFRVASPQ